MKKLPTYFLVAAGMLSSCVSEDEGIGVGTSGPSEEVSVQLELHPPGENRVSSRVVDQPGEIFINDVDALVFDSSGGTPYFLYHARGEFFNNDTTPSRGIVWLRVSDSSVKIHLIVNAREELALLELNAGMSEEEVLGLLCVSRTTKQSVPSPPFPMWGTLSLTSVPKQGLDNVPLCRLMRNVVRIDVGVNYGDGGQIASAQGLPNFKLKNVTLLRARDKGRVAPSEERISIGPDGYITVTSPTMPTGYENMAVGQINYTDDAITASTADCFDNISVEGELYMYENTSGDDATATCVIIGGIFDTDTEYSYYKVYPASAKDFEPLLRNHQYRIDITAVLDCGYPTIRDAYEHKPSGLEADITEWDVNALTTVFDGQYELKTSSALLHYGRYGGSLSFSVQTDYPGGFSIAADDNMSWITDISPAAGAPGAAEQVTVTIDETTQARTGALFITAGNMKQKVVVSQDMSEPFSLQISENDFHFSLMDGQVHELTLSWEPTVASCNIVEINSTGGGIRFVQDDPVGTYSGGSKTFRMIAENYTSDQSADPLRERSNIWMIVLTHDGHSTTKLVSAKQFDYGIEVSDYYGAYEARDAGHTFRVRANAPWTVTRSGDNVISGFTAGGDANITPAGLPFEFTITNNPGSHNKQAVFTFSNSEGLFPPREVAVRTVSELSNSYMIGPGASVMIPVGKAYLMWEGQYDTPIGGVMIAEVLWKDRPGAIGPANVIESVTLAPGVTPQASYITVKAGTMHGNAVVALRLNGLIHWSWHIWVTDYNPNSANPGAGAGAYNVANGKIHRNINSTDNTVFMDRNLGALNANVALDNIDSWGLFYNWGLKDPYVGSDGRFKSAADPAIPNDTDKYWPVQTYDAAGNPLPDHPFEMPNRYPEAITTPYNYKLSWWVPDLSSYPWGTFSAKGLHDPCPPGWRVPPRTTCWDGSVQTFDQPNKGWDIGDAGGWYPLAGRRWANAAHLVQVGNLAIFWTGMRSPNVQAGDLMLLMGAMSTSAWGQWEALSIRCVKIE